MNREQLRSRLFDKIWGSIDDDLRGDLENLLLNSVLGQVHDNIRYRLWDDELNDVRIRLSRHLYLRIEDKIREDCSYAS